MLSARRSGTQMLVHKRSGTQKMANNFMLKKTEKARSNSIFMLINILEDTVK